MVRRRPNGDAGGAAGAPAAAGARAALPLSQRLAHVDVAADDRRELRLFPLKGCGASSGLLFEDDGESDGWRQGDALWLRWEMRCDNQRIMLDITTEGRFRPAWRTLTLSLPEGETRVLWVNGEPGERFTLE